MQNAMCMSRAIMMVHVPIALGLLLNLPSLVQRFVHCNLSSTLSALPFNTNME